MRSQEYHDAYMWRMLSDFIKILNIAKKKNISKKWVLFLDVF